ncbi:KICSTOR complex protein SZT2 [Sesbania bispinosa]|nr:KICSTOR complex protein SZT2 [Sesbania bispinosa]
MNVEVIAPNRLRFLNDPKSPDPKQHGAFQDINQGDGTQDVESERDAELCMS